MSYIVLSIPVFFLLIGVELLIARLKHLSYYRFHDAVTNLSCGIGQQLVGIFLKTLTVGVYIWIYNHSPMKGRVPETWWVGVLLFIGVDFFYYWFHRLAHEVSILWGSHVVHHQSEEYNLTVALRQAWLQGAFSFVFYLPLAAAGFHPAMFITLASFQTLYQFWIHTRLIGKLHPVVEYIFNTPSHHRVHHGVNPKYIDRNHGGTLIIFDRMFGTFQEEEEEVVYGITKQPRSWNPLWLNFQYWGELFRDAFSEPDWLNKLKILFGMPGWKPGVNQTQEHNRSFDPAHFTKYDTEISPAMNAYVFIQFLAVLAGTSLFLFSLKDPLLENNLLLQAICTLFIVFSIVNVGAMFERKRWVNWLELIRLGTLVALVHYLGVNTTATMLTAVFAVGSAVFFIVQKTGPNVADSAA